MGILGSKKFSLKAPAVCKAPPPDFDPPMDPIRPPLLAAAATWLDVNHGQPINMQAFIDMQQTASPREWWGTNPLSGHRIGLHLYIDPGTNIATVTIYAWDQWRNPETIVFPPLFIDPQQPIDTHLQQIVTIPNKDVQTYHIIA